MLTDWNSFIMNISEYNQEISYHINPCIIFWISSTANNKANANFLLYTILCTIYSVFFSHLEIIMPID